MEPHLEFRTYRNRRDMYLGIPIEDHVFCSIWHNTGMSKDFLRAYLQGIVNGLRVKYKSPCAAVYKVDENGNEKIWMEQYF